MSQELYIKINTSADYLQNKGITLDSVKKKIAYLAQCFGTKFPEMFSLEIQTQDIERILFVAEWLKKIEDCEGFKRHLKKYNQKEFESHFFTARTAAWLLENEYEVVIEPEMPDPHEGHPDLEIKKDGIICYIECKTSEIANFFEKEKKEEIANVIFQKVSTCDQIDLFFTEPLSVTEITQIFNDKKLIPIIYKSVDHSPESRFAVSNNLEINVIRKPAIVGPAEDFPIMVLGMIMEDNKSGIRRPGYSFSKGGRSVGIWGPVINLTKKWKQRRRKSQRQAPSGSPFVVIVDSMDVIGHPQSHQQYFNNVWLTAENPQCTGVGILDLTKETHHALKYYANNAATHPFVF